VTFFFGLGFIVGSVVWMLSSSRLYLVVRGAFVMGFKLLVRMFFFLFGLSVFSDGLLSDIVCVCCTYF